jgi:hypothetical protein
MSQFDWPITQKKKQQQKTMVLLGTLWGTCQELGNSIPKIGCHYF